MSYSDYIARIQLGHQLSAALKRAEEAEARVAELEMALASQQPADDGWIEWAGGISPVADDVMVELRLRNGEIDQNIAYWVDWFHSKPTDELDIIAYRVVKP